ncbi:hypothetical protein ACFRCI_09385 [Streptomyces sp. NPDC056638]|uniref:hypothetical protein n=1 Tax=Streptomyces sp. NPDC056638 TaxID=3345887 RepID=UPI00368FD044
MIIVYTPEGGEPQHLNAGRLRTSEIQIIERTADRPWDSLRDGLKEADVTAMRTVAWVIKKREDPSLRFAQFDPYEDELVVKLDDREVSKFAEALMKVYGDDPEKLAEAWDELRNTAINQEFADAAIAEQTAGPKADSASPASQTPETSTSDSSLTSSTSALPTSTS